MTTHASQPKKPKFQRLATYKLSMQNEASQYNSQALTLAQNDQDRLIMRSHEANQDLMAKTAKDHAESICIHGNSLPRSPYSFEMLFTAIKFAANKYICACVRTAGNVSTLARK